jgi:hypothetical protein
MAQSTLHLSFGMLIGTLLSIRPLWRAWVQDRPVARPIARWCLITLAMGIIAVIPALVRRLGDNPDIGRGAGWNLFLFYPLLDRLPLPSILAGELAAAGLFALQYAVILLAIRRAYRHTIRGTSEN